MLFAANRIGNFNYIARLEIQPSSQYRQRVQEVADADRWSRKYVTVHEGGIRTTTPWFITRHFH